MKKNNTNPHERITVSETELNDINHFFNGINAWGRKLDFQRKTGVNRNTVDRLLMAGRCRVTTIEKIREFISSYNQPVGKPEIKSNQ